MRYMSTIAIAITLGARLAAAADWYVAVNGSDSAAGTDWSVPFATVQKGIDSASAPGDTVWVSNGTYDVTTEITLNKAITLRGLGGRDATVLKGGYPTITNRVLSVSAAATVDGFTITNGAVADSSGGNVSAGGGCLIRNCRIAGGKSFRISGGAFAGGIYIGSAVVSNCLIYGNYCFHDGAGVRMAGGELRNCLVFGNTSDRDGGGVYARYQSPAIYGCIISNNVAARQGGGCSLYSEYAWVQDCEIADNFSQSLGGGILAHQAMITNCVIRNNRAVGSGGGIHAGPIAGSTASVSIVSCTIEGNVTETTAVNTGGGGVYGSQSATYPLIVRNTRIVNNVSSNHYGGGRFVALMEDVILAGNTATDYAGGQLQYYVTVADRCTITNNVAATQFGGVMLYNGAILRNSLVAGNTAGSYGGVAMWNQNDRVENCTVVGNVAASRAGLYVRSASTGAVVNTICYWNSNDDLLDESISAPVSSFCCAPGIGDGVSGNTTNTPLFANLAAGNYRLTRGSPCRDAGTNAAWVTASALDLDGAARVYPSGGSVDMGAYEYAPTGAGGTLVLIR